ncbi:MAG: ECF transporter S component [Eubacteriaceae bacterium]|jgi:uncharacterized membrane protein|nr:ECF transporter S component [Eubacteriaceae bacterium]
MVESRVKTAQMTQLTLLIAIMAVLGFTPLGFIQIPPVSITIMHIPVMIGAMVMGPKEGGILGLVFGLISMVRATFMGVSPIDLMFSPFASGYPIQSIIMVLVPRILLGVITGVLYKSLEPKTKDVLAIGLSATVGSIAHSALVLSCLAVLFSAFPLKEVIFIIISVNGTLELLAGVVVSVAVVKPLLMYQKRKG